MTDHPHHAADCDPSGTATCSVAGAQVDPAMLWLRAACSPARPRMRSRKPSAGIRASMRSTTKRAFYILVVASDRAIIQGQPSSTLGRVTVSVTTAAMFVAAVAMFL